MTCGSSRSRSRRRWPRRRASRLSNPKPLIVPILRAGLGMLEGMVRLLPSAEVGFLGMQRNEETLEAITYANRLPDDLSGRQVYVLDPMLATGGSMADAIKFLLDRGADDITAVTLLAAPEGIAHLEESLADAGVPVQARHRVDRREGQRGSATSCRASAMPATGSTASSDARPDTPCGHMSHTSHTSIRHHEVLRSRACARPCVRPEPERESTCPCPRSRRSSRGCSSSSCSTPSSPRPLTPPTSSAAPGTSSPTAWPTSVGSSTP